MKHAPRIRMARSFSHRARGIGALAVVMVLLFVMMLVAAYANRSLLLEQRISANHYRTATAFEAADAGLEWALSQLNAGRVDNQCQPTTSVAFSSFVTRAAGAPDTTTGAYPTPPADVDTLMRPVCTRNADLSGWTCYCANAGRPTLATLNAAGAAESPLFLLTLSSARVAGGAIDDRLWRILQITAEGCNRLIDLTPNWNCMSSSLSGRSYAKLTAQAGLIPALVSVPPALLTARGSIDLQDAPVTLVRGPGGDVNGPALLTGQGVLHDTTASLSGPPGTPREALTVSDPRLPALSREQFFITFFGVPSAIYARLPAVRQVRCTDAATCATALQQQLNAGIRLLKVDGDVTLTDITLGAVDDPVVLVASGTVTLGDGVRIHGFLYGTTLNWTGATANNTLLRGAAAFSGTDALSNANPEVVVRTTGAPALTYDPAILSRLNILVGNWVRVPGSWSSQ